MTKSRQDFHRNAEELAQNFGWRAVKMLKLRENLLVFSPQREGKSRILRKLAYQRSLESSNFLLYVIAVI